MMNPYDEAVGWIDRHPTTGSATRLAKLLLSLWNADVKFSFRECVDSLDETRTDLAVRMVAHFARHGEDADLQAAGVRVCRDHPQLWELGNARSDAQAALRQIWHAAPENQA